MAEFITSSIGFRLFSLVGSIIVLMGALITGLVYRGNQGERYSPLNHYISELGEMGVSRFSRVFNLSLVITGLCLFPACVNLGLMLPGVLARIGLVVGSVCSISLALVGVFPMNKMKAHVFVAMTYFRTGLIMVIIFSLAIAFQPASNLILSRWYAFAGLPPIAAFTVFLILARFRSKTEEQALEVEETVRADVSPIVIAEWMIFFTLLLWFVLISIGL